MERDRHLLIGVDDSEATIRALHYLGALIGERKDCTVCLAHVLPPIPPELLEFGGAEDPEAERQLSDELRQAQLRWLAEARRAAEPTLARAQSILADYGIAPERISIEFSESIHRPDIAQYLIDVARARQCGTIVVGRESFPPLRELVHRHVGEELVRKARGMAVWVVE